MARLARGTAAHYYREPPAVVGPIVILPKGPRTTLAVEFDRSGMLPRRSRSFRIVPTTTLPKVGAEPGPAGREIIIELAGGKRRGKWRLRAPEVVGAASVQLPPTVTTPRLSMLAAQTRDQLRYRTKYVLGAPEAINARDTTPTLDQITIRVGPRVRIRPPAVKWEPIYPAVEAPALLDQRVQLTVRAALVAVETRRTRPRNFYLRRPPAHTTPIIWSGAVSATSAVTGSLLALRAVAPAANTATSAVTAGIQALRLIAGAAATATSDVTGAVSGGGGGPAFVDNVREFFAAVFHYHGH